MEELRALRCELRDEQVLSVHAAAADLAPRSRSAGWSRLNEELRRIRDQLWDTDERDRFHAALRRLSRSLLAAPAALALHSWSAHATADGAHVISSLPRFWPNAVRWGRGPFLLPLIAAGEPGPRVIFRSSGYPPLRLLPASPVHTPVVRAQYELNAIRELVRGLGCDVWRGAHAVQAAYREDTCGLVMSRGFPGAEEETAVHLSNLLLDRGGWVRVVQGRAASHVLDRCAGGVLVIRDALAPVRPGRIRDEGRTPCFAR